MVPVPNPIPVEIKGVAPGLIVVPQTSQSTPLEVRVRVKVPANFVDQVSSTWFQATIDVGGQSDAGTRLYPVTVRVLQPGVDIDSFAPTDLPVTLDQEASRQIAISPVYQGNLPAGYTYTPGQTALDNNTVTLRGPQSILQQVAAVIAVVRLDNRTATFHDTVPLVAQNAQGGDVSDPSLQMTPKTVTYTVTVQPVQTTRTVAVVAQVTGQPADGFAVAGVTVNPVQVVLVGNPSDLGNLQSINTAAVDIGAATGDVTKSVALQTPKGTSAAGTQKADVTVQIRPILASEVMAAAPSVVGLAAGAQAQLGVPNVNLTIQGTASGLKALEPKDVDVTLNTAGLGPGAHDVTPQVSLPEGLSILSITPPRVRVTIIPPPTPTPTPTATPTPTPTATPTKPAGTPSPSETPKP